MRSVSVKEVPTGAQLIDVREADEFAVDRATGAVHLPLSSFTSLIDQIDASQDVYVICKAGGRSAQAVEYLSARGIEAINVEGGTDAWREAALPMES